MSELTVLLAGVAAYLMGSLSFAVIVSRAMGLHDPRTYGSKNPGATNVLRSGSKKAAVVTLLLDGFKGWLPVWATVHFGGELGLGDGAVALVGIAAFLGHLFPVFFGFKGGKGVATAAGVLLMLHPWMGMATVLTWLITAIVFRYSSLAALTAAFVAPGFAYVFHGGFDLVAGVSVMSILLVLRHRPNIAKLLRGEESKIGQRSKA